MGNHCSFLKVRVTGASFVILFGFCPGFLDTRASKTLEISGVIRMNVSLYANEVPLVGLKDGF